MQEPQARVCCVNSEVFWDLGTDAWAEGEQKYLFGIKLLSVPVSTSTLTAYLTLGNLSTLR